MDNLIINLETVSTIIVSTFWYYLDMNDNI